MNHPSTLRHSKIEVAQQIWRPGPNEGWVLYGVQYKPGESPAITSGILSFNGEEYDVAWTGYLVGLNFTSRRAIIRLSDGTEAE